MAHERKRNTDNRHDAYRHTDIDKKVHEQTAGKAVSVDTGKTLPAPFSIFQYLHDKSYIEANDCQTAEKSPFFTDRAEYEVGTLLRDKAVSRLGTIEITLSEKSSGTDGYH